MTQFNFVQLSCNALVGFCPCVCVCVYARLWLIWICCQCSPWLFCNFQTTVVPPVTCLLNAIPSTSEHMLKQPAHCSTRNFVVYSEVLKGTSVVHIWSEIYCSSSHEPTKCGHSNSQAVRFGNYLPSWHMSFTNWISVKGHWINVGRVTQSHSTLTLH